MRLDDALGARMGWRSWVSFATAVTTQTAVATVPSREKGAAIAAGERGPAAEATTTTTTSATQQAGSFVSPESLVAFSGMTLAVTVIWTFVESILDLPHILWIGVAISAVCGLALFLTDFTDPKRSAKPSIFVRVIAALVNTILLFNAASGSHDLAARRTSPTPASISTSTQTAPPTK